MNIKITHQWLSDYLETEATPAEIQEFLSLCGPSIERVEEYKGDSIYDIEVTSNRIDTASVIGVAQEAMAILPMFGRVARMKLNPLIQYKLSSLPKNEDSPLEVEIKDQSLCSRFTALLFDNVKIGPSPSFIKDRLLAVGIKSINNVVDISNYLMVALGQPVHTFDFDKIGKGKMIMRLSHKGEKIVTLDEKQIILPGGDIVIEDGDGKLIDLCGIMGAANSAISEKTKRVLLFVQTYNEEKIRKTTVSTGQRTLAATYFEKGLDEERVEPTITYGAELLQKYAGAKIASRLYDIFPTPYKPREIELDMNFVSKMIGVDIDLNKIKNILTRLGFKILPSSQSKINVLIQRHRKYDVSIREDLIEEIARIYGYRNIASTLPPSAYVEQPKEMENLFVFQNKVKFFLKHLGLNEVINYSMISKKMIEESSLKVENHLRLSNTISEDIEYLRTTLTASLDKNFVENRGKKEVLRLFEIGKVYLPIKNDLPREVYRVGIAVNTDYLDLKGIIEALYRELNISAEAPKIIEKNGVFVAEIELQTLIDNYRQVPSYRPINPYAVIKLDKTFESSPKTTYASIKKIAQESKLFQKMEVISLYKNKLTLRFYYSSKERNITEEEAKGELEKV